MLAYDQPIKPVVAKPATAPGAFSIFDLTHLLWRRKGSILAGALICACAAIMIGKSLTPKYLATAQLYVDPRELQLVDRELTPRTQDLTGLGMVVESQARVITSNSVLLQVIDDTRLDRDPEFGGDSQSLTGSLLSLVGLGARPTTASTDSRMVALDILNRHVTVKRTDRTFIVDIDVWSREPDKAAMLANAISAAYLTESKQSQASAARRATTDLSGRLKELQERLRTAETNLAAYKAKNNFVGTQDTLVSDQQLSASTQRLAAAHALTLEAQAKFDQIEASRRSAADAGAIPEALQSPTIANLRAQYAEARRRYADMSSELGPLHPSLRNMEKQVDDVRRNITEEVNRFVQSAKNDLARARDYEASMVKSLDAQKKQSVDLSQASVRLRELERDAEASRNVYQSFLKRSRETEEQETLNTSSARIIGEATAPQRRVFPPAMSVIAMLGFLFGGLAAAALVIAGDRFGAATVAAAPRATPPRAPPQPMSATVAPSQAVPPPPLAAAPAGGVMPPSVTLIEKPLIARLREIDVLRTLGGIFAVEAGAPDLTRLGWPTLRAGASPTPFVSAMRQLRATAIARAGAAKTTVLAVIGPSPEGTRSMVALNIALAAARDGAKVLLIDADPANPALTAKVAGFGGTDARTGLFGFGKRAARPIATSNGVSVLPLAKAATVRTAIADILATVAAAQASATHDLIVVDGPAMPQVVGDQKLIAAAHGLVAMLPASSDINACLEDVISALNGAEAKLIGVVINELGTGESGRQQGLQYA